MTGLDLAELALMSIAAHPAAAASGVEAERAAADATVDPVPASSVAERSSEEVAEAALPPELLSWAADAVPAAEQRVSATGASGVEPGADADQAMIPPLLSSTTATITAKAPLLVQRVLSAIHEQHSEAALRELETEMAKNEAGQQQLSKIAPAIRRLGSVLSSLEAGDALQYRTWD